MMNPHIYTVLNLFSTLCLAFFTSGCFEARRRQSLIVETPYPPVVGPSYPEDAHPTAKQRQWALATCSVLTEINRRCHFTLLECTATNRVGDTTLRDSWGISNRADLLQKLRWLEEGGHRKHYDAYVKRLRKQGQLVPPPDVRYAADLHAINDRDERSLAVVKIIHKRFGRKGLAGWDFSRYISLCRWGAHAGYITEEEAWQKIMPAARLIQSTFDSWEALAYNYRLGRIFWNPMKDDSSLLQAIRFLREDCCSPWACLSWNVNLLPENQLDDGSNEYNIGGAWNNAFGNRCDAKTWKEHRDEAFKWFEKSAIKGNVSGMYFLSNCYSHGQGCNPDPKLYRQWIEKCIAAGDPWSHYRWAMSCYQNKSYNIDKKYIAELVAFSATNNGSAASVAMYGWLHESGYGATKKDIKKALECYYQAASTEESWAMAKIGDAYHDGLGVEKNQTEAARWYHRSAINGERQSMFEYAECLRKGNGVPANTAEALVWYHQAATNNESRAIKYLKSLEEKK